MTTHIIHNEGDLQISLCVIFLETRHHAQAHVTSGALINRLFAFFGREKNTDSTGDVWKILLGSVCYDDSRVATHLLQLHLVFQPVRGWGDLDSFQLSQSNFSPEGA